MATIELDSRENRGLRFIQDSQMYHGKSPTLRSISAHLGFRSPRSASLLIDRLVEKGYLERTAKGSLRLLKSINSGTSQEALIELPLVGAVSCGLPLLAEENINAWIPVSQKLARAGGKYFLLRATGDSMDQAGIEDGDLLLVREQPVAEDGDRVVALIEDEATVKVFERKKGKVMLLPRSSNPRHRPIILSSEFLIQGIVIDTLPNPLE